MVIVQHYGTSWKPLEIYYTRRNYQALKASTDDHDMCLIGRDWYSLSPVCWTLFRVALIETRGFCDVDDFVVTPAAVSASVGSAQPLRVAGGTVEFIGCLEQLVLPIGRCYGGAVEKGHHL